MLALALSALAAAPPPGFDQALANGRLARARFLAAEALREDPSDPDRWVDLARATDDPNEAEPLLAEALRLRPGDTEAATAHALVLASLGRAEDAVIELEALPASPQVLVALAEVRHDPAPARSALALAPGDTRAALAVARFTGDPVEARAALSTVTEPDRAVLAAKVEQALRNRDLSEAQAGLDALETVAPLSPELERLGRWVACLAREPSLPVTELLEARRRALVDPLHPPKVQQLTALAPSCSAVQALVATLAPTPQARIDAWKRAVELAPGDAGLLLALGRELLAAERPSEARTILDRAHQHGDLAPTDLGRALVALGEEDEARRLLDAAASHFPDDAELALVRAQIAPDRVVALAVLVGSLKRTSDPRVLARARELAELLDQTEDLADVLRGPRLPPLPGDVSEEVVVIAKDSRQRFTEVIEKLKTLGYRRKPTWRGNGDVHFAAEGIDRPAVTLHPDGLYDVQREGLVPIKRYPWLEDSPMMLGIISEQKLGQHRERVMAELQPELRAWREALCREGFEDRLLHEIPGVLDQVWREGVARDGSLLPQPSQRRTELLQWWVTRSCTPEGDAVRGLIVAYLGDVVQRSDSPVTPAEVDAINARRSCAAELKL
jgi:tetratricopeptide (TPR) repeat protein